MVKQQRGSIYLGLGTILVNLGDYAAAQQTYEESLKIFNEMDNLRDTAAVEGQLGDLSRRQGKLTIAAQRYQSAIKTFQQLTEPNSEATAWHQLGIVYQDGQQWEAADQAYRESARIKEQQNIGGAAITYNQLAILNKNIQKPLEAEQWYRKALQSFHPEERLNKSNALSNLADLLVNQPSRLIEAHQLATDALAIQQTFDPAAASIWNTYNILAEISTVQAETNAAREYRQLARTTKAAFAGTQYELQQHESFIAAVVAAVGDKAVQAELEPILTQKIENGWGQLVAAIRRVLAGEREVEVLWDDLDLDDSMIIAAILGRV
jgi:tetratricopeptide (TPR) repeat protein